MAALKGSIPFDGTGKLVSVTSIGEDATEEFHYDQQGKKTGVRTIPPRPAQEGMATSVEIMFETSEEGEGLSEGGSVTTRYNDDDQPIESLVRDAHGELMTKIVHNYENGLLVSETLTREALDLPKEFLEQPSGEQLSEQQRRAMRTQMKALLSQHGFDSMERSYVYDNEGRVSRKTMQMGNLRIETSTTYNEHGDEAVTVRTQSGSLGESPGNPQPAHLPVTVQKFATFINTTATVIGQRKQTRRLMDRHPRLTASLRIIECDGASADRDPAYSTGRKLLPARRTIDPIKVNAPNFGR
jgi:hypothetical protein